MSECYRSLKVNIVAMLVEAEAFFLNGKVDIVLNDLNPQKLLLCSVVSQKDHSFVAVTCLG